MAVTGPSVMWINGRRLAYDEVCPPQPQGTILLLTGAESTRLAWSNQRDVFGRTYRTIALDYRDTGDSDPVSTPYTIADLADDAVAVLDAIDVQRANVVGISLGGYVALQLAVGYPDRVATLVLVATAATYVPPSPALLAQMRQLQEDQHLEAGDRMVRTLALLPAPGYLAHHPHEAERMAAWAGSRPLRAEAAGFPNASRACATKSSPARGGRRAPSAGLFALRSVRAPRPDPGAHAGRPGGPGPAGRRCARPLPGGAYSRCAAAALSAHRAPRDRRAGRTVQSRCPRLSHRGERCDTCTGFCGLAWALVGRTADGVRGYAGREAATTFVAASSSPDRVPNGASHLDRVQGAPSTWRRTDGPACRAADAPAGACWDHRVTVLHAYPAPGASDEAWMRLWARTARRARQRSALLPHRMVRPPQRASAYVTVLCCGVSNPPGRHRPDHGPLCVSAATLAQPCSVPQRVLDAILRRLPRCYPNV